jgi:hypothetical protein
LVKVSLAALISIQFVALAHAEPKTLSVCDVLAEDPTRLNSKVIAVNGLVGGSDEALGLSA